MIVEVIVSWACSLLIGWVDFAVGVVTLPIDAIAVLGNITGFGTYILGIDLVGYILTTVAAWTAFKLSAGLFIWIYRLLPFV